MNLVKILITTLLLLASFNKLEAQTPKMQRITGGEKWHCTTIKNQQIEILLRKNLATVRFGLQHQNKTHKISITFNSRGTSASGYPKDLSTFSIPNWAVAIIKKVKQTSNHASRTKLVNLNRKFTNPKQ